MKEAVGCCDESRRHSRGVGQEAEARRLEQWGGCGNCEGFVFKGQVREQRPEKHRRPAQEGLWVLSQSLKCCGEELSW